MDLPPGPLTPTLRTRLESLVGPMTLQLLVAAGAVVLALALTIIRGVILAPELAAASLPQALALLVRAAWQDWLLCATLVLATLGWQRFRGAKANLRLGAAVFLGLCTLFFLWGLGNILSVRMLGEPVTMQWLGYSDLMNSTFLMDSLTHFVNFGKVLATIVLIVAFNVGCVGAAMLLRHLLLIRTPRVLASLPVALALVVGLLVGLVAGSSGEGSNGSVSRGKTTNAAFAFAASVFSGGDLPEGLMQAAGPLLTSEPFVARAIPSARPDVPPGQIRNVVFFVLESTAARFIDGFGSSYGITPNLDKYAAMGRKFTTTYAHAPATNYSLVALTSAIVPELSSRSMTEARPDLSLVSIGEVLRDQGLRTGFFSSSDKRFQNTEGFARSAGFDTVLDNRDWPCRFGVYGYEGSTDEYLDTSNDLCTVPPMLDWVAEQPDQPFFAMLWTGMPHYPYFPGDAPQDYVTDPDLNRYLNAVRVEDAAFGELMTGLAAKNLLDSTLVVVVGDHGEAFGEHGQFVHASALYDENLRVPLLLINPVLFKGDSADTIAGISDLAPTVLDLMALPAPATWQGKSLFSPDRPDGVLFFAPWNGFQIGFRDGNRKYIHNGHTGEEWLFDLAQDPEERTNLATSDPQAAADARKAMAGWIAAQNAWTQGLIAGNVPEVTVLQAVAPAPRQVVIHATGTSYLTPPRAKVSIDGVELGEVAAVLAPGNADTAASDELIAAAVAPLALPVPEDACPKRLEVSFLNDEWQGEGKTGDTNFSVYKIELDGKDYWPSQYSDATNDAGGAWQGYYTLYGLGSFTVDLDISPACLTQDLDQR